MRLPLELLDIIIDEIDDFDTLKAVSLVSKSLIRPAQRRLFHRVEMNDYDGSEHLRGLQEALTSSERVAEAVRTLEINGEVGNARHLMDFLAACTRLRTLRAYDMVWPTEPALVWSSSTLRTLELDECIFRSYDPLVALLRGSPCLMKLSMETCQFERGMEFTGKEMIASSLRTLEIHGLVLPSGASHILEPFQLRQLERLILDVETMDEVEVLRKVLTDADVTLQRLQLEIYASELEVMDRLLDCLLTAKKSRLRVVELLSACIDQPAWFATLLRAFSSPLIETIGFDVDMDYPEEDEAPQWELYDKILSSTVLFPSLTKVAIFEVHDVFVDDTALDPVPDLCNFLPRTEKRGILLPDAAYREYRETVFQTSDE
ncbi:hypothetical protein PUNSTDRAFT_137538 [Punctularia strigosozonata HHB-11173 SS5]|uniref:uncharacterized protein n=1 Tax=Punctularia strigosozonata (strain HHB-11173) TaxID=741275 RepID=UPI00044169AA|nr:uncharacterized protein PUNSTDRAFT_137538 [Punctularia strigosozonata HHB-11173 SS5]EIN05426.1 hypothetical protein PUNSTDRAFT_137538 [Punctularia strigosozonata HHB-11173 SS5]